ncbi:hypothetical protein MANES_06G038352v8 [Manihot esculenta]|uniref:Uncharacterized protein n=1 Tax=Manihot esculenta TaxID=3983 RepID=A0ACB7HJ32_MANES|nr:hypothetical protein MANES_06G038352v8 [Manihot esculenta]
MPKRTTLGDLTGRVNGQIIPFSAFWLRSSVVSVLISLISDTSITVACYWGFRASPLSCTTARAWRTFQVISSDIFQCSSSWMQPLMFFSQTFTCCSCWM